MLKLPLKRQVTFDEDEPPLKRLKEDVDSLFNSNINYMAYRKKKLTYRRKRSYRKKRTSKKRSSKSTQRVLRPEKKRNDISNGNSVLFLGQVNNNNSNFTQIDVTPVVNESISYTGRIGSTLQLVTSYLRLQFIGQANTTTPIKVMLYWIWIPGIPINVTGGGGLVPTMFNANPFVYTSGGTGGTIYDYNSEQNPDYFRNFRILRKKNITIPMENYQSGNIVKEITLPINYNRGKGMTVRYNGDTTTVAEGQLAMVLLADAGNTSGTASTMTNIPIQTASSGLTYNYYIRHFYYDV